ncbi:unnamed protein product [Boreogadus saida]
MEAPTYANAPCVVGVQRPTDEEIAAVNHPLVPRTAAIVYLALALEGTVVQALLDLAPEDQRDLRALLRALERRFGQRVAVNHSREDRLGAYAADIQLHAWRGYPDFPAAASDELALHSFLQGLAPLRLGQQVRLMWLSTWWNGRSGSFPTNPACSPPQRIIARTSLVRPNTAAVAVVPGWTRLGQPSPVAQRQWRSSPGRERTGLGNPGHRTSSRSSVGESRTVGGLDSGQSIPAASVSANGPDGGGQRRMESPNNSPAPPYGRNWWGPRPQPEGYC